MNLDLNPWSPWLLPPHFYALFCRMRTCNSDNGVWFSFLCLLPIGQYCKLSCYVCYVIYFIMYHIKSGIGSCIAPKAGIARHPAKGRYKRLGMLSRTLGFWCSQAVYCPGPGYILGQPRVCHRQAQRARVQAPNSIPFHSIPIFFLLLRCPPRSPLPPNARLCRLHCTQSWNCTPSSKGEV